MTSAEHMGSDLPVVVIGAGIAGLTLRRALRAQGIPCAVYEQAEGLATRGAGLTLWPNATSVLDRLDCLDELMGRSFPLTAGHLVSPAGQTLAKIGLSDFVAKFGWPVLGVARSSVLAELCSGDRSHIHFGKRLIGIDNHPRAATAYFADGTEAVGCVIVGADGINSATRDVLGAPPKRYSGYIGLQGLASVETEPSARGISNWLLGAGSQFGVIPTTRGEVYFFGTINVSEHELDRIDRPLQMLTDRFSEWGGLVPTVLESLSDNDVIPTPIYDRPPTRTWSWQRVTALGDAAHGLTPTFGQGACLAIESAEALALCLAQVGSGRSVDDALSSFEQERIRRTRWIVHSARAFGRVLQIENPVLAKGRNRLLRWTPEGVHQLLLRGIVQPGLR